MSDSGFVQPTSWTFKGTQYNSARAYQGPSGLWYVWVTCGSGRSLDRWELHIFPPHARFSSYQGAFSPDQVLPMSQCLWSGKGRGGRDYGKGFNSKGGYRPAHDVSYSFGKETFDGSLLGSGDDFVREILGYGPSVAGIRAGIQADEEAAAEEAAEEAARAEVRLRQYEKEREAHEKRVAEMQRVFESVDPLPNGWHSSIRADGMHVWQQAESGITWGQQTFKIPEEYADWRVGELSRQAEQSAADAKRQAEEAERQASESRFATEVTSNIDAMRERLAKLKGKSVK